MKATTQDGRYPRPTLVRETWVPLDGTWDFAYDDGDVGLAERWHTPATDADPFDLAIEVPFPPESPASGIGRREPHPVVWYRRTVAHHDLLVGDGDRALLHLGAVDHRARVWVDGQLVATHVGGSTPFTADVTDALAPGAETHVVVVRAEDDQTDTSQARGKQDWRERSRGIWYERTTGIWQSVWAESVPAVHVAALTWTPYVGEGFVRGEVALSRRPSAPTTLEVTVSLGEELLARQSVLVADRVAELDVHLPALRNGQDRQRLLWAPEHPTLLDVSVRLLGEDGQVVDEVESYTGLRSVEVDGTGLRLNGHPYHLRAVLNQGYRPETHLATRGTEELRAEVETIRAMGFNTSRNHQKVEDPRWLFWADRLGLLVWGEMPAHYGFSPDAVTAFAEEWSAVVRRDAVHPSVVLWVPINESWGVQDVATSTAQQQYLQGLASLTRAIDPSRPVVSNEGWEHVDSDVIGLHDYTIDAAELRARYLTPESTAEVVLEGRTPHGRRSVLTGSMAAAYAEGTAPVMITEFGGVSLSHDPDAWGYTTVGSDSEYAALLMRLFDALRASSVVRGICYTQYMDTGSETNGLLYSDGTPKIPLESIREIVTGEKDPGGARVTGTVGWPD